VDIDPEQIEAEEREETLQQLEAGLLERLDHEGHAALWKKFKTGLHCERFFESPTGKKLADRLIDEVLDAQNEWLSVEPDSKAAVAAHRRALAAKMAIFSIDTILQDCHEAEIDLRRIEQEVGT
jgi:hypothetical protein